MGVLMLLAAAPLSYAQRQEPQGLPSSDRESEPTRELRARWRDSSPWWIAPIMEASATWTRMSSSDPSGYSVVFKRRAVVLMQRQHVVPHHDVEVDIGRPRFWHGFVFGARLHGLRTGMPSYA